MINRKKIIMEIMGEEAEKRGFTIDFERKQASFWPIAIFKRTGPQQLFEIREDLEEKGKLSLMHLFTKEYVLYYTNNESFVEAIKKFQAKLIEEGFDLLDKKRNQPSLSKQDYDYVCQNYVNLAQSFGLNNGIDIDNVSFGNAIDIIEKSISSMVGKDWDSIKQDFYSVTAFYIQLLLRIPDTKFYQYDGKVLYVERTEGKRNMTAVMSVLFTALRGNTRQKVIRGISDLLLMKELEEYGIK